LKHYFKYKFGYINIDDENLYLTKTGNWQETKEITEKSKTSTRLNRNRKNTKLAFYWILYAIVFFIFNTFFTTGFWITTAIILTIIISLLFFFYKRDFGKQYKIPLSKIESIVLTNQTNLNIRFRNTSYEPDNEIIKGLEKTNIDFLMKLANQV